MATQNERRKYTRVQFKAKIDVFCGGTFFKDCDTHDLSTKGVFVSGVKDLDPDTPCDLVLYLSGGQDLTLKMKGTIQRITDTGAGIYFTETDLDSFTHLKNIIYFNSDDPDELEEGF